MSMHPTVPLSRQQRYRRALEEIRGVLRLATALEDASVQALLLDEIGEIVEAALAWETPYASEASQSSSSIPGGPAS
jgi:hypothetical protein